MSTSKADAPTAKTAQDSTDLACQAIALHIQNIIDCEGGTILGSVAHELYFRGDYVKTQQSAARFAVYYVGETRSELKAVQSTLEKAETYIGAYCVLVILKPHDWQADQEAKWAHIEARSRGEKSSYSAKGRP